MSEQQCKTYFSDSGEIDIRLFESSADCIKIISLNGHLQKINPGASQALEVEDLSLLYGLPWVSLWPNESHALITQSVSNAAAGVNSQFVAFCPTAKGSDRWWDVIVNPIFDAQKNVCEIMAISRDVTELYSTREALKEAIRQKDEFLIILAHELRNPLSAAGLAATVLEKQTLEPVRIQKLAQVVKRQISFMSTLIEDLIDLARVARGDIVLKLESLDMRTIITDVIEQLQGLIKSKHHTLSIHLADQACVVHGDRVRLIQAVGNLLGNAARYTPDEGKIEISVQLKNANVQVSVKDNGIGIAKEDIVGIFERYTQVDKTSDRQKSGLGLGLSLVSKIALLHLGKVEVASDGENKGSSFVLTLPALQGDATSKAKKNELSTQP